ncbi:MAG TPA: 3-ketoacyl-ACP reductase [Blastocatellia bacterium]|nr:3-ketoacyl-ACP reductase [Blastocatellia bacterium]
MKSPSISERPVALVTGASRGIGKGIAIELARAGYDLMINYASNEAAAEKASAEVLAASSHADARVRMCRADVSGSRDRQRLLAATRRQFGRLDLLVNNAGVAPERRVDLLEATEESFDRLIRINLKGPYFLSQAAARWMIEQRASRGLADYSPAIINITSISAYTASPERGDYCVAKAGLAMMTSLYATRLAAEGVNVYEVRPGVIATDMTSGVKEKYDRLIGAGLTPIARWGTPEDVGRAVAAIARGLFPFSTGEVINVDGGFHLRRL